MYVLHDYARMLADAQRMRSFVQALEACVRPGSVVVDMGTGTGIFALVACRLGARRVIAIDTNDAIEVARELARENGCADRVEFLKQDVREVVLPEKADVVVSDMRGGMPMAGGNLSAIEHARRHFLAPHGTLIPARDTLYVAVVSSSSLYASATGLSEIGEVTLGAMRTRLCNSVHRDRARVLLPADLVTTGVPWATLEYGQVSPAPVHGRVSWSSEVESIGHGLALWFDTVLHGQIGFSTRPGTAGVYPQLFLPWPSPIALQPGDRIDVELWVQPGGEAWGWNTRVDGPRPSIEHKQSTFLGDLARPAWAEGARARRFAS